MTEMSWVPGVTLESMERSVILEALKFYRGNVTQCAKALGVSDRTIYNKVAQYEQEDKIRADKAANFRSEQARILDRMRGIVTPVESGATRAKVDEQNNA